MRWLIWLGAALFLTGCDPAMSSDAFDEYSHAAAVPMGTDQDSKDILVVLHNDGADSLMGLRWESPTKAIAYVVKGGKKALRWYVILRKDGDRWTIVKNYYDWMTEPYETTPPL